MGEASSHPNYYNLHPNLRISLLSFDEDSEVGEGRGEEVTTSQSSASMQVLANVVVSCSHVLSLNYYCHFLRILIVPCLHLIALPICGSMMRRRRKRRLGWSMALLPSVNQVLRGLANSFESKVGDSCNHRSKEEDSDDSDLNSGSITAATVSLHSSSVMSPLFTAYQPNHLIISPMVLEAVSAA